MAGGRDWLPRSPRWLNGLVWSSGLGATAFFLWRMLFCEAEPNCVPPGLGTVFARLLACLMLPVLLAVTMLARALKWATE